MLTFGNNVTQFTQKKRIFRSHAETIALNTNLSRDARFLHYILTYSINIDTNSGQITHEQLAEKASMCVRTVIRNIVVLEQAGLITVDRAPKGSKIPNIYHLAGEDAEVTLRHGTPAQPIAQISSAATMSQLQPITEDVTASHMNQPEMSLQQILEEDTGDSKADVTVSHVSDTPERCESSHPKTPERVTQRQTLKQESVEMIIENDMDVVVVEDIDTRPIFKLEGVEAKTMLAWTKQYGVTRLKEVLDALPRQKNVYHAPGWVAAALKHGWELGKAKTSKPKTFDPRDGRRYITGPYSEIVEY